LLEYIIVVAKLKNFLKYPAIRLPVIFNIQMKQTERFAWNVKLSVEITGIENLYQVFFS